MGTSRSVARARHRAPATERHLLEQAAMFLSPASASERIALEYPRNLNGGSLVMSARSRNALQVEVSGDVPQARCACRLPPAPSHMKSGLKIFRLRPRKEVSFSQEPTGSEKTTCDGRRSSKAEDPKPTVAVVGGISPPNFQPW